MARNYQKIVGLVAFYVLCNWSSHNCSAQVIQGSFESKFKRYQKGDVFLGDPIQTWDVVGWKGERIHKQIILWSSTTVNDLTYDVSDLVNGDDKITSSAISLRFGKYVKGDAEARSCSEYETHSSGIEIADALSKTELKVINASDPLKVWVTIDIPINTETGNYSGSIKVSGQYTDLTFSINLEIVDYALPEVSDWNFHLDLWQFPMNILNHYNNSNPANNIEAWSDAHFALFEPSYKVLADMGQKAITAYIKGGSLGAPSMISWTLKSDDITWEYDYTAFDKYVTTLMSWGINKQINCFSPVGWNEDVIPYFDETTESFKNLNAPIGSATFSSRWDHFLTAFKSHLDSKGWFDKTVLYLDEVSEEKLNSVSAVVHGNNANWKLGIAYARGLSVESKSKFYDLSGILEDASNEGIPEDKISTFYTSCTQTIPNSYVTPANSPAEMTWMGWHALSEKYDGYLRWAFDYWRSTDPFDMRDGGHTAGDFGLIYRNSNNAPMSYSSSIRLEMLRDGIQDFEKVKILKQRLEASNDPFDQQALGSLNQMIEKFGKTSGEAAIQLVTDAQKMIVQILIGEHSYCRVGGGENKDYYVKKLSTSGADTDITIESSEFPERGYLHHSNSHVEVFQGAKFNINLENSPKSNCARTKVWVDWNGDEDYIDEGEEVFSSSASGTCGSSINHSFEVEVPKEIHQKSIRARVRVVESNEPEPISCGINDKSGAVDFNIEILDKYCRLSGSDFEDYFVSNLNTKGGRDNQNLAFVAQGFPENGYEQYNDAKVVVEAGSTFMVNLENSPKSNCARTKLWADWNNDNDFDDANEEVYNQGVFQSCNNTISKAISVDVPTEASLGITRMRVRLRDAWLDEPESCGESSHSGSLDFNVEILEGTIINGLRIRNYYEPLIFPNPSKGTVNVVFDENRFETVKVRLVNMGGQVIYQKEMPKSSKEQVQIKISNTGIYFLKMTTTDNLITRKVIVDHSIF